MKYKHKHIVVGGTFDVLHRGHKLFMTRAFNLASRVTIGLVSDSFATETKGGAYQHFERRYHEIITFLNGVSLGNRARVIKIDNFYGTTLSDKSFDSILVTRNTKKGAIGINNLRRKLFLKDLIIEVFPLVFGNDKKAISSSRIRSGEIDENGVGYYREFGTDSYKLPTNLRKKLQEPFGAVYKSFGDLNFGPSNGKNMIITVGDKTTQEFLGHGVVPTLAIIDFNIQRQKCFSSISGLGFKNDEKIAFVKNPAGIISKELSRVIYQTIMKNGVRIIKVDGEEDLAVLPVGLIAPLGSNIYYGLRNVGLVKVKVTSRIKQDFLKLLRRFAT